MNTSVNTIDVLCWDTAKAVEYLQSLGHVVTIQYTCAPRASSSGSNQFVVRQTNSQGTIMLISAGKQQLSAG